MPDMGSQEMTDDTTSAGAERAERVAHLTDLIQRYIAEWRDGDLDHGPWPEDPDGGELRLVMCLKLALPYLPCAALTLVETELLVPQRRQAARDRTQAVLEEAAAHLETVATNRPALADAVADALAVKIRHVLKENQR